MADAVTECPTCRGGGAVEIRGSTVPLRCYDCAGTGQVWPAHRARILRERREHPERG